MIPSGIVDPTKVTRSALENAASICSMRADDRISGHRQARSRWRRSQGSRCRKRSRHGRYVLIPENAKKLQHPTRGVYHPVHAPGFCLLQ